MIKKIVNIFLAVLLFGNASALINVVPVFAEDLRLDAQYKGETSSEQTVESKIPLLNSSDSTIESREHETELTTNSEEISQNTGTSETTDDVQTTQETKELEMNESSESKIAPRAVSWIEQEFDYNEAFIVATESAVGKNRAVITITDVQNVQTLKVTGASSIPDKISDFSKLKNLTISNGTVSQFPDSFFSLRSSLSTLDLQDNRFVTLPEGLLDSNWPSAGTSSNHLDIGKISGNQIVTDIPASHPNAGMFKFNTAHNLLENYNYTDYHNNPQDQLAYKTGTPTIKVPVGFDFTKNTPNTTSLAIYDATTSKYRDLFEGHEFEYYDDGGSSSTIKNGIATNIGNGYIYVKSKFSTPTNQFAKTRVNVKVEQASSVTVHYQDESGTKIIDDVTLIGLAGDNYTSEQKVISGYTFKEVQGETSGQFSLQPKEVTYVYKANPILAEDVTLHFVDESKQTIAPDEILSGNIGDNYVIDPNTKPVAGYTFKVAEGVLTGAFTNQKQEITLVYTANNEDPISGENIVIHFVNQNKQKIKDDEKLTGNIDDAYTIDPNTKLVSGYRYKEAQGALTGFFTDKKQEVTLIYEENSKDLAKVIVHYVDINGAKLVSDDILEGKEGSSYETKNKEITGYTLKEIKGMDKGIFSNELKEVTYVYSKDTKTNRSYLQTSGKKKQNSSKNIPALGENKNYYLVSIGLFTLLGCIFIYRKRKMKN